jgi:hypothetical protein
MSWYAIESVDDAIDATRSFLFPVELSTWLKLALISIFVSVGGSGVSSVSNIGSFSPDTSSEPTQQPPTELPPGLIPADLESFIAGVGTVAAISIFVVAALIIIVGLSLLSETLRLVLYDALRTQTVRLRKPARRRFGQALRLFGFKLAVSAAFAIPFVVIGATLALTGFDLGGGPALIAGILLAAVIGVLSFIAYLVINRATNEFVAPIMVLTDSGVLDAWRQFWPVLRTNVSQFGVYVVVHFLLLLAISIGQSILGVIVFGIVGTVGALVGLLLVVGVFGGLNAALASTAGLVALGLLVALTLLAALALFLPINIVVLTYVFSYELSVLGAADEDLRLLPEPSEDSAGPASTASV